MGQRIARKARRTWSNEQLRLLERRKVAAAVQALVVVGGMTTLCCRGYCEVWLINRDSRWSRSVRFLVVQPSVLGWLERRETG